MEHSQTFTAGTAKTTSRTVLFGDGDCDWSVSSYLLTQCGRKEAGAAVLRSKAQVERAYKHVCSPRARFTHSSFPWHRNKKVGRAPPPPDETQGFSGRENTPGHKTP